MGKNVLLVAKTLFGFEDILAEELIQLGALHVKTGHRMVTFEGDDGFIYKANLACRTAIKILRPIASGKAQTEKELYDFVQQINWSDYLDTNQTLAIDATTHSIYFQHSKYAALLTKDAIVDQFRAKTGSRPNIDTENPDMRFNIHIQDNEINLAIDTSGKSLHLRGYRTITNEAPINEVLAAGLLIRSGWKGQSNFLDPMCGSGTILIEAAMIACNIPCNIHRSSFAFMRWKSFDANLFETIKSVLLKKTRDFTFSIQGFDIDFQTIKKAKININHALLDDYIEVKAQNFFTSSWPAEKNAPFIFFNPPYNERINIDTENFYGQIGSTLKHQYAGAQAWIITSNETALKSVGLKPSVKIKTFNGALEARLVQYQLYAGSKKINKNAATNA